MYLIDVEDAIFMLAKHFLAYEIVTSVRQKSFTKVSTCSEHTNCVSKGRMQHLCTLFHCSGGFDDEEEEGDAGFGAEEDGEQFGDDFGGFGEEEDEGDDFGGFGGFDD